MKAYLPGVLALAALGGVAGCQEPAKKTAPPEKAVAPAAAKKESGDQVVMHVDGMF